MSYQDYLPSVKLPAVWTRWNGKEKKKKENINVAAVSYESEY